MTHYFVSSAATGGGTGTTTGSAYTMYELSANIGSGDVGWVAGDGLYNMTGSIEFPDSVLGYPNFIKAYTGVTGDGGYAYFDDAGYRIVLNNHTWIEGLVCEGVQDCFIDCSGDSSVIFNCKATKTGSVNGKVFNSYDPSVGNALINSYAVKTNINSLNPVVEGFYQIKGCFIRSPGDTSTQGGCGRSYNVTNNIFVSTGSAGSAISTDGSYNRLTTVKENIIYGFYDGILLDYDTSSSVPIEISHNVIYNCANYGINDTVAGSFSPIVILDRNAIGNCTAGRIGGLANQQETNGITLTADPFNDASNDDFRVVETIGGGKLIIDAAHSPQDLV